MEVPDVFIYVLISPFILIGIGICFYIFFEWFTWGRNIGKWIINKFAKSKKGEEN